MTKKCFTFIFILICLTITAFQGIKAEIKTESKTEPNSVITDKTDSIQKQLKVLDGQIEKLDNEIKACIERTNDQEMQELARTIETYREELKKSSLTATESFRLNQQLELYRKELREKVSSRYEILSDMIKKSDHLINKKSELEQKLFNMTKDK